MNIVGLGGPIKFCVQRAKADQLSGHEKTDVEEHAIVPTRRWPNDAQCWNIAGTMDTDERLAAEQFDIFKTN